MITEREKHLMREAMYAGNSYSSLDQWLNEVIDDKGDTVADYLDWDANRVAGKAKGNA